MEKIYDMHKMVGLQLFLSRTPTFSSGTPTFCQMGVLNSCIQNPSESSGWLHKSPLVADADSPHHSLSRKRYKNRHFNQHMIF